MAMTEKVAHDTVAPVGSYPANHGIPQAPSPISHPGSPPPAFQEGMTPVGMSPYQSAPIAYQQQHQMGYPPQQAPFNQQPTYLQQPNQQQAFHPQMVPQPMPGQPMPGQLRQFQNTIAIPNLSMGAAPVDCPVCGARAMTSISYHSGNTTHVWAGITCCLTGLFCFVPYMMNSLKDIQHRCGSCGTLLATWHKSGQVEQHIHA